MSNLYSVIKTSYGDNDALNDLLRNGYVKDEGLSNDEFVVLYNQTTGKMIFTIAGTRTMQDVGVDIALGFGALKSTGRYTRAKQALDVARNKYNPTQTVVSGHSMGAAIAQNIGRKTDKIVTLDGAYTIGQRTRGKHYRSSGDIISVFGAGAKHTTTLERKKSVKEKVLNLVSPIIGGLYSAREAHRSENIRNDGIFV